MHERGLNASEKGKNQRILDVYKRNVCQYGWMHFAKKKYSHKYLNQIFVQSFKNG